MRWSTAANAAVDQPEPPKPEPISEPTAQKPEPEPTTPPRVSQPTYQLCHYCETKLNVKKAEQDPNCILEYDDEGKLQRLFCSRRCYNDYQDFKKQAEEDPEFRECFDTYEQNVAKHQQERCHDEEPPLDAKPCPFCGGTPEVVQEWDGFRLFHQCSKHNPELQLEITDYGGHKTAQDALKNWNQRFGS